MAEGPDGAKLKAENARLRNQVKCLEIEVEQKDESERVIADLSKQNAALRRKLDDALEKLGKK